MDIYKCRFTLASLWTLSYTGGQAYEKQFISSLLFFAFNKGGLFYDSRWKT